MDEKDPRANTKDGNGEYYIGKDTPLLDFFNDVRNKVYIDRHAYRGHNNDIVDYINNQPIIIISSFYWE